MTAGTPAGDIVDALGVKLTRPDGDLPSDAIVILRCTDADGDTVLRIGWSDGMDWITRLGMLRAAYVNDELDAMDAGRT